jgi:glycosyltransferase involved in cell wall biosynthesis
MTFSLLMPSYNQARFIGEAVASVLAQDDPDWELWILDNSTDETPQVMEAYRDQRIHFVHEPARMDPGSCLNWMLERAVGEHFSYIHTDNRLLPSFVRSHRRALAAHPLAVAVCDYWEITEAGARRKLRRRQDPFPLDRLFSVDTIGVPFAATLELARRLGGFATTDLADDVLFVLRADALGPRVHIHEPQMEYRVHGGSRFLASGVGRVQRAIHRSIVEACRERPAGLPDPFQGGDARALHHVDLASRMALVRTARQLRGLEGPLWVEGAGPESFWSAWACFRLGRTVAGFVAPSGGELLGLPVAAAPPEGGRLLRPQLGRGALESLAWMLRGLPPLDHPLKRLPGAVMSGLLVPYQLAQPEPGPLFLRAEGAMGAYLAYGAELLAGLRIQGLLGPAGHWPPLEGREPGPDASVWAAPGAGPGTGLPWTR